MTHADSEAPARRDSFWRVLMQLRWLLAGTIGLAFALGQLLETLMVGPRGAPRQLIFDVVGWGLLGGLAVWLSLTWASRQEHRYRVGLEESLAAQQRLNQQLQRANAHLALLSDVNRHIADSNTLDDMLDAALDFPQRLVRARGAALVLCDSSGLVVARVAGASAEELSRQRAMLGVAAAQRGPARLRQLTAPGDPAGQLGACLALTLHDGSLQLGWIELYLERAQFIPDDELALLETIASEIAEAITGARRRSREERAIYELERAIAEERSRIARDVHDGIAQTLAFRRMRVDLWLDWIASDPQRLQAELRELKRSLREDIAELRRAIFALRPIQFDELGFVGGLHRYIAEFSSQHGWHAHIDLGGVPPALPPELEATCFRVVQEALTNAAKHAAANRVEVVIDQIDGGLRICIRDDGRGFEPGQLPGSATDRVGLRQMRERLAAVRGQLTLLSQPAAGTEVRAWIPLA